MALVGVAAVSFTVDEDLCGAGYGDGGGGEDEVGRECAGGFAAVAAVAEDLLGV